VYKYPDPYLYGGVAYSGAYRVVYFSFGYEAINSQAMRDAVMSATLDYLGMCSAPQAPQAGFVSNSPVNWGDAMVFTNTTLGTAWMTYTWNFGDNSPASHAANPTHLYAQSGSYNVVLTATSRYGSDSYSRPVAVTPQPSDITISPAALSATLKMGDVVTYSLQVSNWGESDLIWSLVETPTVDWLAASPINGAVPLSASVNIQAVFDASGLACEHYTTTLQIASNDPDEPLISAPVTLTVRHTAVVTPTTPTSPTLATPQEPLVVDFAEPVLTSTVAFTLTPSIPFTVTWTSQGLRTGSESSAWYDRAIIAHRPFQAGGVYTLSVSAGQTLAGGTIEPTRFIFIAPGRRLFLPAILIVRNYQAGLAWPSYRAVAGITGAPR
jgi:PKD repeat protein